MIWAVLPLKDFMNAKQRLSGVLAPHERRALFQAMVEDVLQALSECTLIEKILIISDDPTAGMLGEHYHAITLAEAESKNPGLNAAVRQGADYVIAQGGDTMLVIHGDLPLASKDELTRLCRQHQQPGVSIAPDTKNDGSNVMLCSPPNVIDFHYGAGSCQLHSQAAQQQEIYLQVLPQAGLAIDVDSPADLIALIAAMDEFPAAKRTRHYLQDSDVARRIHSMGIGKDEALTISSEVKS